MCDRGCKHTSHRWPFFFPDGKHFLYLAVQHESARSANDCLYYASLDGRENRVLFRTLANAIYAGGLLLFARGDQLMAQTFDPGSGTLSGEAQSVSGGLVNDISTWRMDASASDNGLLVLGTGGVTADTRLVWVDRSGKETSTVADKLANVQLARLSPQGDRIALQMDSGATDIWMFDLSRGVRTRLTFGPVANTTPVWSPDGKWIAYSAFDRGGRASVYRKPSDGSGAEELLFSDEHAPQVTDWSQDGKYLIFSRGLPGSREVWAVELEGERKPWLVVPHAANSGASGGHLSSDNRWIAYSSAESGGQEVYVAAFRGGQGKWQVSVNRGAYPKWSKDGKELYYFNDAGRTVFAVPVKEAGGALQFGAAQALVSNAAIQPPYDVSPDGNKILLDLVSQQVGQSITVVTNFTAGLRK